MAIIWGWRVIATLKGTASPERFYVITGHLDSRVSDVSAAFPQVVN